MCDYEAKPKLNAQPIISASTDRVFELHGDGSVSIQWRVTNPQNGEALWYGAIVYKSLRDALEREILALAPGEEEGEKQK